MPWFSKKQQQPVAVVEPVIERKLPAGPRLAVLTPDIAGISSFRLNLQGDAGAAELAIAGLRTDVRRGTHAFWAMHERPAGDEESMHVETLVLIRAKSESDLVYVVSFLDLESALSFTRFEVRRGLYIGNVMIYWAAFVQIREELEGVSILPQIAPSSVKEPWVGPDEHLAPPLSEPQASVAVAEPQPEVESITEAEAREAVERYLQANPDKPAEPIAEPPAVVQDSIAVIEPPVVREPPAPVSQPPFPIFEEEPATEEAAVADALVLQHPPVAEPRDEVQIADSEALQAIAQYISTYAGDEEAGTDEPVDALEIEARGPAIDPAHGIPQAQKYSEFDIALEVERLRKNRKLESRDGPFRGFKSPPGRF